MLCTDEVKIPSFPNASAQSFHVDISRICYLLEQWIRDYPYDFKVRGTPSALSALFKSITSKTYLLHYGAEFLPFHELLPNLVDEDAAWALKIDEPEEESDYDDGERSVVTDGKSTHSSEVDSSVGSVRRRPTSSVPTQSRERKASLPLTAKSLIPSAATNPNPVSVENLESNPRHQLRELNKLAAEVNATDSEEIAQEITRLEVKLFLDIEVCSSCIWNYSHLPIFYSSLGTG